VVFTEKILVVTGTVTYAVKGRDLLRRQGYKASIERVTAGERIGCGYGILTFGDPAKIKEALERGRVKILEIRKA
jgi:hypothetical protein